MQNANAGLDGKAVIEKIQDHIDRMPSLSTTATKVLEVCNQPNTSANDLNRVISLDPVLTGQVLKLINSAYYALPGQITSLTRAIIVLGLNTVKNLALSTSIIGSLGKNKSQSLSMDMFWNHSICVGVAAKTFAIHKNVPVQAREEYFIAGLLHDLGKIPLSNCFAEDYNKVIESVKKDGCELNHAEGVILGIDHCETGKMIAEKWKLSERITTALAFHHEYENAAAENLDLVLTVAQGNIYANSFADSKAGDQSQDPSDIARMFALSGLDNNGVSSLDEKIKNEIENAQIFLQVSRGDLK